MDALTGVKDLFPSTGSNWQVESVHPAIATFLARLQGWLSVCKHLLNGSIDLDSILIFLPISLCCCCGFLFLSPHTVYVRGLMNLFCWHVVRSVFLNAGLTFFLFSPFLGSLPCWSPHTHAGSRCTRLGLLRLASMYQRSMASSPGPIPPPQLPCYLTQQQTVPTSLPLPLVGIPKDHLIGRRNVQFL